MSDETQPPVKVTHADIPIDTTLEAAKGWHELQVRWLVTRETVGAEQTVVGLSVFPPGAKHDLHRHPNAEEWEYVLEGNGVKRVGDVDVPMTKGDTVFVPANAYHGLANVSDETLVTLWGYSGASSLEAAGYVLPEEDDDPRAPSGPWRPSASA